VKINHEVVVFDAADLHAVSGFWAGVLGGVVEAEDDWHMVMVGGKPRVGVQLVPNHARPEWPDGVQQQQIHLDLWVDDIDEAHETVMSLGAELLQSAGGTHAADTFQVCADPAGHPFCPCWIKEAR
jgi:predicted enzyme related to lactoylglutathione lyase